MERYNKTIVVAISILVKNDHRSWDTTLSKVQFALNTAVNESTRFTPFSLVHGREAVPSGKFYGPSSSSPLDLACASRDEYMSKLGVLHDIFGRVEDAIAKAHFRSAVYYDKGRQMCEFNVGDVVWKKTFPQSDASKFLWRSLLLSMKNVLF